MKCLIDYITESLKDISTNYLATWRSKVAKPDYYRDELTTGKYIRHLVNAIHGKGFAKVQRSRWIEDFVEMYFGNYLQAKEGSFTLAKAKNITYEGSGKNSVVTVTAVDKWYGGILAGFTFKLHVPDLEKYTAEEPEGDAGLTILIKTPVYTSEKEYKLKETRKVTVTVPARIPEGAGIYNDLASQLSAQTRDMNWGIHDPIPNRYSKDN